MMIRVRIPQEEIDEAVARACELWSFTPGGLRDYIRDLRDKRTESDLYKDRMEAEIMGDCGVTFEDVVGAARDGGEGTEVVRFKVGGRK
jgi:hypothetical protein